MSATKIGSKLLQKPEALERIARDKANKMSDVFVDKAENAYNNFGMDMVSAAAREQARIDAENEYASKKQEIENQITTTQDEIDTYRFNKKLEKEQLIVENDKLSFEKKLEALTEQER